MARAEDSSQVYTGESYAPPNTAACFTRASKAVCQRDGIRDLEPNLRMASHNLHRILFVRNESQNQPTLKKSAGIVNGGEPWAPSP